ncbi:hypothetical protein EZV62_001406 [Acer yangbiense]|uniref:DUF4283 domain-containing protein n=1 Tax=Acer yangbiense TaxID=1000413 RepID=A0A5C7IU05_9ROSI|nr:hypothetical protein EZV62_001406 [Acer yangbiense]
MEEKELTKRCEASSICGRVPTLNIIGETHKQSMKEVSYCLVGKVLPQKRINRETFIAVITKIWNIRVKLEIKTIRDNDFLFHFTRLDDRSTVWIGHVLRDYYCEEIKPKVMEGKGAEFGSWLKAVQPIRLRDYKQRDNKYFRAQDMNISEKDGEDFRLSGVKERKRFKETHRLGKYLEDVIEGIETVGDARVGNMVKEGVLSDNRVDIWDPDKQNWQRTRSLRKAISNKQKEIEELLRHAQIKGMMHLVQKKEKEPEGLLVRDEIYWRQRSIADWLLAGDLEILP